MSGSGRHSRNSTSASATAKTFRSAGNGAPVSISSRTASTWRQQEGGQMKERKKKKKKCRKMKSNDDDDDDDDDEKKKMVSNPKLHELMDSRNNRCGP